MVKEDLMWKRYKYMILSFIFVVGIFVVGVKLPDFVSADAADKLLSKSIDFTQGSTFFDDVDKDIVDITNPNNPIRCKIDFRAKFTPQDGQNITNTDIVEFDLGDKLQFAGSDSALDEKKATVKQGSLTICEVVYTRNPSNGNIRVKFDFTKADAGVFVNESALVGSEINLEVDKSKIDNSKIDLEKVRLGDKSYKIKEPASNIVAKKIGVIDAKNGLIHWTTTVTRTSIGLSSNIPLGLAGYKWQAKWNKDIGEEYVDGSLNINGNPIDDTEAGGLFSRGTDSDYKRISYRIRESDQTGAYVGKLVIKYSTRITFGLEGKTYLNTSYLFKPDNDNDSVIEPEASVELTKFGTKSLYSVFSSSGEKIDDLLAWVITFNEGTKKKDNNSRDVFTPYDLGTVTITDSFGKDTLDRIGQKFVKAYYKEVSENYVDSYIYLTTPTDATDITPIKPSATEEKYKFTIPNVNKTIKLYLFTRAVNKKTTDYLRFKNTAKVSWGTSNEHSVFISNSTDGHEGYVGEEKNGIKKDAYTDYIPETYRYPGFEAEWKLEVPQAAVDASNYYLYDTFIFDTSVNADRSNLTEANGFSVRKLGETTPRTTLDGGSKFEDIMPENEDNKHLRLINPESPMIDDEAGMSSNTYELLKNGKVVGHIVEINLAPNKKNKVRLKTRIVDKDTVFSKNRNDKNEKVYNFMVFTQGNVRIQEKKSTYQYKPRMIRKDTLTSSAAIRLETDKSIAVVNDNLNNKRSLTFSGNQLEDKYGFNPHTKSIVYRISVNASKVNDPLGEFGKIVVEDNLQPGFKFVPIAKDENGADRYFLIYKGKPLLKDDTSITDATVEAVGSQLTSADLVTNNITSEATVVDGKTTGYKIGFENIDGPYVILLKAELVDQTPNYPSYNYKSYYNNIASLSLEGSAFDSFTYNNRTNVDLRFLSKRPSHVKDSNNQNGGNDFYLEEPVVWTIDYMPNKKFVDDGKKVKIIDTMDSSGNWIALRKENGTDKLIFEGSNYKIVKGSFKRYEDQDGIDFVEEEEITEGLDKIFTYDTASKSLIINIPDKKSGYRISYITDFTDKMEKGKSVRNKIDLYEGNEKLTGQDGVYNIANVKSGSYMTAYGVLYDLPYNRLSITKVNAQGVKLSGAVFKLKKLGEGGNPDTVIGTDTTNASGQTKFDIQDDGDYILTEETAPTGYFKENIPYKIKVKRLEVGFQTTLDGDYEGFASLESNNLKIINYPETYETFNIIKTNVKGEKLHNVVFRLKKEATATEAEVDKGTQTTDANGEAQFTGLTAGSYTLTEETSLAGYLREEMPYKIKLVRAGTGYKTKLAENYGDKVKLNGNNLTVVNYLDVYATLNVTKSNAKGDKLSGAKFKLIKDAVGAAQEEDKGTKTTDASGEVKFEKLTAGNYTLKEEMPPTGYKVNNTAYKLKIVRNGDEFTTVLVGSYEGKAKYEDDKLTVINLPVEKTVTPPGGGGDNPKPEPPSKPNKEDPKPAPKGDEEPKKPDKPEKPKKDKPSDKGGKDKPSDPDEPSPKQERPSVPTYPLFNTPDPNHPDSPYEIQVTHRDGTPIGRFIKKDKEDGKKEYVLKRDGTPLTKYKYHKVVELPKTGGVDNIYYYLFGAGFALASGMISGIMARRRYAVRKRTNNK
jgi:hypothetical protein